MLQAGPIVNVHLPKDRVTQTHQGYGFVEFASEDDADYAVKIMNQIRLWGKPIRVNKASADRRGGAGGPEGAAGLGGSAGVGAELFIGNLDSMVEEKMLFETFSRFGALVAPPKVARDEANLSKGYGFISYASFDASDDAIANMHGQYLMTRKSRCSTPSRKTAKASVTETKQSVPSPRRQRRTTLKSPSQPCPPVSSCPQTLPPDLQVWAPADLPVHRKHHTATSRPEDRLSRHHLQGPTVSPTVALLIVPVHKALVALARRLKASLACLLDSITSRHFTLLRMLVCLLGLHQVQPGMVALLLSLQWAILTPCLVCLLVVHLPAWEGRHPGSHLLWAIRHPSRGNASMVVFKGTFM